MKNVIITDLDRTLSDCSHRAHHLDKSPRDWDAFYAGQADDPVIEPVLRLVWNMQHGGHEIHVVTGRPERFRAVTEQWLHRHSIPFDHLHLRPDGDYRQDDIWKEEVLDRIGPERVLLAIEDRSRIVRMFRRRGILCLQCADGDF